MALLALPVPATGQITGTAHDFSGRPWSDGEICRVCHTPHNADATVIDAPLWNHELTSSTFTVYSSPTMDQTPLQPQRSSKLCLSCHDGVVAVNSYAGGTGTEYVTGSAMLGTDLMNDHPVSVYWNHQTEIKNCTGCHQNHPFQLNDQVPFEQRYVECSSCHDVHGGSGEPKLLRMTMQGSQLCLYCHQK